MLAMLKKQRPAPQEIILMETLRPGEQLTGYEGCSVYPVAEAAYDHAATRREAVSKSSAQAFILLTQDAVPVNETLAASLLKGLYDGAGPDSSNSFLAEKAEKAEKAGEMSPGAKPGESNKLRQQRVAMCYGRQLPAENASMAERLAREFNYPAERTVKSAEDLPRLGIKTYFASNVCCAYDRGIYDALGGFADEAIFNEDMLYAAKAMKAGYAVVYEPDAVVIHSHNYSALQQLHRNFDNGMSQAMYPEVFGGVTVTGEGVRLVKETAAHLLKKGKFWLLPKLFWQSGMKYLGFKAGKNFRRYSYKALRKKAQNKAYIDRYFRNV